ncbi:2-methylcitrate dehydratase [Desulfosarcina widdelii]|uniref:2-methylcitrate dehydratase n=1 Tax=Desulfosarcina widdelii TaxID=947919 RepID=A0A5K7YYB8_9BACT|nr:MmgE/PrpD family protein [Desulfosarcina widdelii]BBO73618.1 2-methylcitrate dehydratase [Desulfosarcina widdelii]
MSSVTPVLEEMLVDYIAGAHFEDLDSQAVDRCKKLILDTLGVAFPGSRAPGCPQIVDLLGLWQTDRGASVLLSGVQVPPPMAAMANSAMMHAMDFDDTLDASALHTFVNVLPAALAAAENSKTVSGKELITALVVGVDIICRISLAIDRPLSWIRTATCGCFGAAASAAKILGLDREEMFNALGVVYGQTSGNAQGLMEGCLVKRMQPGFAASAGVLSAFLAGRGITGSRRFLTGPYGYYPLYERGEFNPIPVTEGLGRHYSVVDLSIKPYPSCRMTHASIDAALALKDRLGPPDDIDHIDVSVCSMGAEMVGKPFRIGNNPQVDAQFSIPYTTACAIIRGDVFLRDFEADAIADPTVMDLARRVRVVADPTLPAKDILPAEMTVTLKDGAIISEDVPIPLGHPHNPMNADQCRRKFLKCLDYSGFSMREEAREEVLSMIDHLETLPDVRDLIRIMAG